MRRDDLSNEEVLAAFSDWRSQYSGGIVKFKSHTAPLVRDEKVEMEIAAVREFARFIEPKLLAESTIADIDAFKRQLPRGRPRSAVMGIELFRTFRTDVLKPRKAVRVRPDGSIQ
jgi:hypothetical protein